MHEAGRGSEGSRSPPINIRLSYTEESPHSICPTAVFFYLL